MRKSGWICVLLGSLLLLLCTGCAMNTSESMYALPKQSDAYYDLQKAIDGVMLEGDTYSGPLTGSNQQAVQLADLDGDGKDEAIVFIKSSGEKPLRAYIFDRSGDSYEKTSVIEGDGSSFDCVEYAQLDGEPGLEILVGRQLSDQIHQYLSVYSYRDGELAELMGTSYSEFKVADLDGDVHKDVVVLRLESESRSGVAELYRYDSGVMLREQEAPLSAGIREIRRIVCGNISQGVPAVFVASVYEDNALVTDIFGLSGNRFLNLAINSESGVSSQTIRSYQIYATDIDGDGVIELPSLVALPSATAEETFWLIEWYSLGVEGSRKVKMTTYHNYYGSWYLILPERWKDAITISRVNEGTGRMGYMVSKWNGYDQPSEEIFTIHALTGDDRLEQAKSNGNFLLAEKGETAYAASLGSCSWAKALKQSDLSAMFRFIYLDWDSGET